VTCSAHAYCAHLSLPWDAEPGSSQRAARRAASSLTCSSCPPAAAPASRLGVPGRTASSGIRATEAQIYRAPPRCGFLQALTYVSLPNPSPSLSMERKDHARTRARHCKRSSCPGSGLALVGQDAPRFASSPRYATVCDLLPRRSRAARCRNLAGALRPASSRTGKPNRIAASLDRNGFSLTLGLNLL
jgi:hypothetical protein